MIIYHNQPTISSDAAMQVVQTGIAMAREQGKEVTIAVVAPSGHLMAQWSTDHAKFNTPEFAYNKAFTAAMFQCASTDFYERIKDIPAVKQGLTNRDPRYMTFPGGLPIIKDGQFIGAVGVSGGSAEEDIAFAKAGIASLDADFKV